MSSRLKEIARENLSPLMKELQDRLNRGEWIRAKQVVGALEQCLAVLTEETNLLGVSKEVKYVS